MFSSQTSLPLSFVSPLLLTSNTQRANLLAKRSNPGFAGSDVGCRNAEMQGLQGLIGAAGQQRLCSPWEGLQGSTGSAGPGLGCRSAQALQALGRAAGQHRLCSPWEGLQVSTGSAGLQSRACSPRYNRRFQFKPSYICQTLLRLTHDDQL